MNHRIEIYGEATRELISILLKNAKTTINTYCIRNNYNIPPINNIFFSEIKELGLYQLGTSCIILSNKLLDKKISMEFVNSILLHELSHYICYRLFKTADHSLLFKKVALEIGAPIEFTKSSVSIKIGLNTSSNLSKIKKLLALSESQNINESKAALNKARKLMVNMNIKDLSDREYIYSSVLFEAKRFSARHKVLFMLTRDISGVFAINNRSNEKNIREQRIFGTKSQVEIALYIYDYLSYVLDKEYQQFKNSNSLKGRTLESFYYGVYEEMFKKFNGNKDSKKEEQSLIIITSDNKKKAQSYYYDNNSYFRKGYSSKIVINKTAFNQGKKVGSRTTIHQGINKKSCKKLLLN